MSLKPRKRQTFKLLIPLTPGGIPSPRQRLTSPYTLHVCAINAVLPLLLLLLVLARSRGRGVGRPALGSGGRSDPLLCGTPAAIHQAAAVYTAPGGLWSSPCIVPALCIHMCTFHGPGPGFWRWEPSLLCLRSTREATPDAKGITEVVAV